MRGRLGHRKSTRKLYEIIICYRWNHTVYCVYMGSAKNVKIWNAFLADTKHHTYSWLVQMRRYSHINSIFFVHLNLLSLLLMRSLAFANDVENLLHSLIILLELIVFSHNSVGNTTMSHRDRTVAKCETKWETIDIHLSSFKDVCPIESVSSSKAAFHKGCVQKLEILENIGKLSVATQCHCSSKSRFGSVKKRPNLHMLKHIIMITKIHWLC